MTESNTQEVLVKELILGVGFLEGLWIYVKMNPTSEILKVFASISPVETNIFGWFTFMLFMITLIQIGAVYAYGGVFGLVSLILAYLGGIFIGSGALGVILVIIAMLIGSWCFSEGNKISFQEFRNFFR